MVAIEELPLYVVERVEDEARPGGARRRARSDLRARADAPSFVADERPVVDGAPWTVVVSRILPVPLDDLIEALASWRETADGRPTVALRHHRVWLVWVAGASERGCRVLAFVRRVAWSPGLKVELDVSPWSASRTELEARPRGRCQRRLARESVGTPGSHRSRRYYAVANTILDYVSAELLVRAQRHRLTPESAAPATP
jgi:hypothetical protein